MTSSSSSAPLSRSVVLLLALSTALTVSSIYLLQPLLHTVSVALPVSEDRIGLLMTVIQIGYGMGILFLIPLGDVYPKKSLILLKFTLLCVATAMTGLAQNYELLLIGCFAIGIFATTAQDIVPFAADLASDSKRGSVIGTVMSGLLIGILLSRTLSGAVSDIWGWRSVFWVASIAIGAVAFVFYCVVPPLPARAHIHYLQLLHSTLANFAKYPVLRRAIITQGLLGFAFSAFWTNLSFFLGKPPFALSNTQIGLFGIAGAAGAMVAPIAGRIADRKGSRTGILVGGTLVAVSFVMMAVWHNSLLFLVLGTLFFDLGIQMALISHQSEVYALDPALRSRLNALFVASLFAAFAAGSLVSVQIYAQYDWRGVLTLASAASFLALLLGVRGDRMRAR